MKKILNASKTGLRSSQGTGKILLLACETKSFFKIFFPGTTQKGTNIIQRLQSSRRERYFNIFFLFLLFSVLLGFRMKHILCSKCSTYDTNKNLV